MVWKKALAAAGAKALGGIVGGAAQSHFSAKQAQRQMDFQERMSNTAYQRAADDLEAAGLNRIIALGSPASTPGGAMGQVADFGSLIGGAVDTGISAYSSAAQVEQSQAQTNKILQETKILTQKEIQEIEKSKLWEVLGPVLQDAAGDVRRLQNAVKDPNLIADLKTAAEYTKQNVTNNIITVISDNLGVESQMVERIIESAINVGSAALNPIGAIREKIGEENAKF